MLFGRKKNVDIDRILRSVDEHGGRGVVQVPIQLFAKYLHENGEQKSSTYDSVVGFISVSGVRRKVVFQHGKIHGLGASETRVTVFKKSNIEDALDSMGVEHLAKNLADSFLQKTTSLKMALPLTYALLCETTIGGEFDLPNYLEEFYSKISDGLTQFDEGQTEAIQKNLGLDNKFRGKYDDEIDEVLEIFKGVRNEIYDETKKQTLSYLVMKEILKKWEILPSDAFE